MNWRATQPSAPAARSAEQPRAYRARRRYDTPTPLNTPFVDPLNPDFAGPVATQSRQTIALIGDSMAEALAFGFEADPALKAAFALQQKTVSASGIVRDDFFDWPKYLTSLTPEQRNVAAIVIALGLNDRQILKAGSQTLEPLTDAWKTAYTQRVDAVIGAARQLNVPVIWVGLPVMRSPKHSTDAQIMNEIFKDRIVAAGQSYVDLFEPFSDAAGGFSATGPDVLGDNVRLRGPDGIHFTPAGQRKLAFFVERGLRRVIMDRPAEPAPLTPNQPGASSPGMALPVIETPVAPEISAPPVALPKTGEFSLSVAPPDILPIPFGKSRTVIGEVRPLAETVTATSLVGKERRPATDPSLTRLYERGLMPDHRAGRADDFSWQRP